MKVHEIGRHTLELGDDGVFVLIYRGDVSADEMRKILDTEDRTNVPEVVLFLCDTSQMGRIDAQARKMGAETPKPAKRYFTAYVGAGFGLRVIIDMWTRATNFIHGKKYDVEFFDDYAPARAWLLARREAFEQGKA